MAFYDLHVHTSLSIGEDTLEDIISFAQKLGLSGIGIARYYTGGIEPLKKREDIDIVSSVLIKPTTIEEVDTLARKVRNKTEVLMVHGGNYDINRAACENPLIDVLCHPELGRKDSGIDHICVKAAADNNVAIEINFREILESYKKQRVYVLSSMRKNIRLCEEYGAPVITTSGAVSKWNMRAGRGLAAITHMLGYELGKSINSASTIPETIVRENREKLMGVRREGVVAKGEEHG